MELKRLRLTPRIAPPLVEALLAELRSPAGAVVLEGGDGVFCEGLDLAWTASATADEKSALLRRYATLLETVSGVPVPSVALVDGKAAGGGLALAAAADLVIATPASTFALPEVFAGLAPAVALPWVARRTGPARARRLALGARPLDAGEALAAGLCDEIAGDPEAALAAHVARWRRAEPAALAAVKALSAAADEPDYLVGAVARMEALLASEPARRRIARALAGESPWEDDS